MKLVVVLLFIFSFTLSAQIKSTYTYAIKEGVELKLDVYQPNTMKENQLFPTLLWIHGGGFAMGSRDYKDDVALCETMAKKGYVAVSISYRLLRKDTSTGFGCDCPKQDKLETFKQAISDYYDAAFYLVENQHKLHINPHYIIAGGSSAGAETVLNAIYLREYFLDNLAKYSKVQFAGVWSLAGAVVNADYITKDNIIPTVLFHGTKDNWVPYATAPHHYCASNQPGYLMLEGSASIAAKLQQLQAPYYFYSVTDGMHEIATIPIDSRLDDVLRFFNESIIEKQIIQTKKILSK